jgi:hypothetical protein
MSLTAAISPRTMALSGNPVKLEITSSSPVNYVIRNQSNVIFEGSGETGNFFVFIDEILSAILSPTHYTGEETDIILSTSSNTQSKSIIRQVTDKPCNIKYYSVGSAKEL